MCEMVNRVAKSEFKQSLMLAMKAGQQILVELSCERDYDRVGSMCRLTSRRFAGELKEAGIAEIKCERAGEDLVLVSAISKKEKEEKS